MGASSRCAARSTSGSTPSLREWLARASEGGRQSLVVDLRNVDFMAVSGLYVLCDEQARMARHHARLTIVCASARMLQLFEVCRLMDVLRIVPSRAELDGEAWGADDERARRAAGGVARALLGRHRRRLGVAAVLVADPPAAS